MPFHDFGDAVSEYTIVIILLGSVVPNIPIVQKNVEVELVTTSAIEKF